MKRVLAAGAVAVTCLGMAGAAPAVAAPAAVIGMARVQYDSPGDDLPVTNTKGNAEYILVKNYSAASYNLAGWTLRDRDNHVYTFPSYTLPGGSSVTVHTGTGSTSNGNLYQNSQYYIWNDDADTAYLRAFTGTTVNTCAWTATGTGSTTCPAASPAPHRSRAIDDYTGDGKTDVAVFRPTTGTWYVHGGSTVRYGQNGDIPV